MPDLTGFDANDHEPSGNFDPIPRGEYPAHAISSEWKETKAGTGRYLQFAFELIEGEYKGRKEWARLNLDNPNATAVKIANGELSAICRAVGVMKPKMSEELHNKPLLLKIDVEERNDKPGVFRNVIKGYAKIGDSKPAAGATPDANTATANGGSSKPPWAK